MVDVYFAPFSVRNLHNVVKEFACTTYQLDYRSFACFQDVVMLYLRPPEISKFKRNEKCLISL